MGMVIGGRAARACDVCGRERARWFCAADAAYLCERCDSSVHGANSVAKRHERVRLTPNGAPLKVERSSSSCVFKKEDSSGITTPSFQQASRKKPRTSRHHLATSRFAKISIAAKPEVKVKTEPFGLENEVQVPDNHLLNEFFDCEGLHDEIDVLHEVTPICGEQPSFDFGLLPAEEPESVSSLQTSTETPAGDVEDQNDDSMDFLVPGNSIEIQDFLTSGVDLCDLDVDHEIARILGESHEILDDKTEMLSFCHDQTGVIGGAAKDADDRLEDYKGKVCVNGESPRSWLCKVKLESSFDFESTELNADTILGRNFDGSDVESRWKLGLRLNFEDVLNAWSDRGSLWMDGHRPSNASCLDLLLQDGMEMFLVPDLSFNSSSSCSSLSGEHLGQLPLIQDGITSCSKSGGAREARVMRYREKRRTRLFSKKIRYEVRKLNAEKRPRLKGRFVKRTPGMS